MSKMDYPDTEPSWAKPQPPLMMREAVIVTDSYAGIVRHPCVVIGETPKKYRVRMKQRTRLPRCRWVYAGEITLVPKSAVDFLDQTQPTNRDPP